MNAPPTAAVLIIGNEILSGKTQDANLGFLGQALARLGIELVEARVIRDAPDVIAAVVNELRERYSYVFTTGGIGPTHDDVTAESVSKAFGVELELNDDAVARIGKGGRELNPARLKMAMIPAGAALVDNPVSNAPGFRLDNVYVMAGIPSIAQAMFGSIEHELVRGREILSGSIDIYRSEGDIAGPLDEIAKRHGNVEIGSYPFSRDGRYGASIVVRGTERASIAAALAEIESVLVGAD